MCNIKRGFTLMELVLIMILISILAVVTVIGFSSYIDKGNTAGILTDFNSTFLNPVRINVITTGKLPKLSNIRGLVLLDGFEPYTGEKWVFPVIETENRNFGVEQGIKRYELSLMLDSNGEEFIRVRADHSKTGLYVDYYLDELHQDVFIKYSESF